MSLPAYLYARFSSAEQAKGHSLERQLTDGKAYIEEKGWQHDASREIVDEGRSAFHGVNREEGSALHEFERRAVAGHFHNGVVLAVENIDRLTRQGWEQATDLLRKLTGAGVTVAFWQGDDIFHAGQRIEMADVMKVIMRAEVALDESDKKSKRLKRVWKTKIERAAAGDKRAVSGILPGWLEKDKATGLIVPIPHRVKVLNWIFDSYIGGKGLPWIERELNERKEPKWGRGKQGKNGWEVSTLHKYLTSRAVLGEYAPKVRASDGRAAVSRGIIIPDYYPQVISADKFNKAQAVRKERQGFKGRNPLSLPNLFSGIPVCSLCGGKMHMIAQNKGGRARTHKRPNGREYTYVDKGKRSYLQCNNAKRGMGCTNKVFLRYEPIESGLLTVLMQFAFKGQFIAPSDKANALLASIAENERLLDAKRQQLRMIVDNLTTVFSPVLAQKGADLDAEVTEDAAKLAELRRDLEAERGRTTPKEDLQQIVDVREALDSEEEEVRYAARAKAQQALRRLLKGMECTPEGDVRVIFGRDPDVGMTFNKAGELTDVSALTARRYGPNGEPDWHPDEAA